MTPLTIRQSSSTDPSEAMNSAISEFEAYLPKISMNSALVNLMLTLFSCSAMTIPPYERAALRASTLSVFSHATPSSSRPM